MKAPLSSLLGIAVLLASTACAQRLPERFVLAIVRLDGLLVPFAAYDAGGWEQAWPQAGEAIGTSPGVEDFQSIWSKHGESVPSVWQVRPASGGGPIRANVEGIEVVEAHCSAQVALVTDQPGVSGVRGDHARKFGMAVDSNLPPGAIEEVSRSDAQWAAAEEVICAFTTAT